MLALGFLLGVPCAALATTRGGEAGTNVAGHGFQIPWTLSTYPNPKVNLERCGRGGKVSHICDPERLVDRHVLDGLDARLEHAPVSIQAAVMGDVSSTAFHSSWDLDEGFHAFAAHLARDWAIGKAGVFVLYSVNDGFVDIQADPSLHLDAAVARHIARAALRHSSDPGKVLEQVLAETLAALSSQHNASRKLTLDRSRLLFFILTCSLGIVALLLTACCAYDMAAHWHHQARFRSCRSKIQKIHEAFAKGYSDLPLCPICVENLPAQDTSKACPHAVVFLCGHRFHTDCANSWLVFNDAPGSCPVCELPHTYSLKTPGQCADEEACQPSDEIKAFFLTSLRSRFPESISEEQVKRWRNCHTEIWLNELQPRRYHSIWHSWGSTGSSLTVPLQR